MKQKLALLLVLAQQLNHYVPVMFALAALAGLALLHPCPATGGGPGGGV
jgi:hypothetical protein